jgi:hypothetical protein
MRSLEALFFAFCLAVALCSCQAHTPPDRAGSSSTAPPPPFDPCLNAVGVIPFESGSDALTPIAQEYVGALHARSRICQPVQVTLAVAGQAATLPLARRRAEIIEGELVRLGVRQASIRTQACTPTATLDAYTIRTHPNVEGGAVLYVFWHYLPQDRLPSSLCYSDNGR